MYSATILLAASDKINPKISRLLAKVQGNKLNQLRLLIEGNHELKSLYSYLDIRTQREDIVDVKNDRLRQFNRRLLEAMSSSSSRSLIGVHMLGRICVSGSYPLSEQQNSIDIYKKIFTEQRWEKTNEEGKSKKYQALMGRYDVVTLQEVRPMCRCKMPSFSHQKDSDITNTEHVHEKYARSASMEYPTFFIRREMVLPVRLNKNKGWNDFFQKEVYALLSVTLNRPAVRLDFLYRIINAIESKQALQQDQSTSQIETKYIEDIGGLFTNCYALLSDGWGDVIFVFLKTVENNRLDNIFEIQNTVYEDFQVDRTELILTPDCLFDASDEGNNNEKYRISFHLRLLEDRVISHKNDSFRDQLCLKGKNRGNDGACVANECLLAPIVTRTPGRMDFSIRRGSSSPKINKENYECLLDKLINKNTDRIQTNIGQVFVDNDKYKFCNEP